MGLTETAYAKINLALHVRQRREDGYHELETLFAFVDAGDVLAVREAAEDRFIISGEFGPGLTFGPDNLVLKALRQMRGMAWPGQSQVPPLSIHLEKNLPVAAGIGGGSADAAAMIRLLDRQFVHNGDARELCLANQNLGADVAACIVSQTRIGTGLGERLSCPEPDNLAGSPVLLVNPRVALATGPVFKGWDGVDRGALPTGTARDIALAGRNDLEAPAIALVPQIADVLAMLHETAPFLARMSGSGATCFALYPDDDVMAAAQELIAERQPDWWQMAGHLR